MKVLQIHTSRKFSFKYLRGVIMGSLTILKRGAFVLAAGTLLIMSACGSKPKGGGGGSAPVGKVEAAFLKAASENKIPARVLMATGYLESQLIPQMALANYVSIGSDEPTARGTLITETAFAQTYATLGLDPNAADSQTLEVQTAAYAKWLRARIDESGLSLNENPRDRDDLFYWIHLMAKVQRNSLEGRQNVQILFAKELIDIMNKGFLWQDQRNGETLKFQPEQRQIKFEDFSQNGKNFFNLTELQGRFFGATYLPLATVASSDFVNKPRRVEVIHCPLTLSGCLELQTRNEESDVHMAAHYVIPQDTSIFPEIVQVADHHEAVVVTNSNGEDVPVTDAIVVMLVGNSGRNISGKRTPANPTWFTYYQLKMMQFAIEKICDSLVAKPADGVTVKREECISPEGDNGVRFRHQGASEEYRWGDIADFDKTIFEAYFRNRAGLQESVAFEFPNKNRQFPAGTDIPLLMHVGPSAHNLEVERLTRCHNGTVVWETIRNRQVLGETKISLNEKLHDAGPNGNGQQFFRMRVYGRDGLLTGWAVDQVFLTGIKNKDLFASEKHCD
jgi:hypothetical protein